MFDTHRDSLHVAMANISHVKVLVPGIQFHLIVFGLSRRFILDGMQLEMHNVARRHLNGSALKGWI